MLAPAPAAPLLVSPLYVIHLTTLSIQLLIWVPDFQFEAWAHVFLFTLSKVCQVSSGKLQSLAFSRQIAVAALVSTKEKLVSFESLKILLKCF